MHWRAEKGVEGAIALARDECKIAGVTKANKQNRASQAIENLTAALPHRRAHARCCFLSARSLVTS